jgi:hypothetical protein
MPPYYLYSSMPNYSTVSALRDARALAHILRRDRAAALAQRAAAFMGEIDQDSEDEGDVSD